MASWTRRVYNATGITEYPAGPGSEALRQRFGGRVVLALDVSGSMACHDAGPDRSRARLEQAVLGCRVFVTEAVAAGYEVGVILWHHHIQADVACDASPEGALALLASAHSSGGNDVVPCLTRAHELLGQGTGDRVVAVFGDGDLGDQQRAQQKAAVLVADNIRILTCGLGDSSAADLAVISTETSAPRSASAESIGSSIAAMATGLKRLS